MTAQHAQHLVHQYSLNRENVDFIIKEINGQIREEALKGKRRLHTNTYRYQACEQVKNYYTENGFSVMLHDTDAVFNKPEYTGQLIILW